MVFLTRRLVKLTPDEINALLKADDIISTIKSRMTSDRLGRNYESVSMKLYFPYDEDITISYVDSAEIDRILYAMANSTEIITISYVDIAEIDPILYAMANSTEIITEVNDEGDEDGQ